MQDNYDFNILKQTSKRKNSRTKGHRFERDVAKILNEKLKTTEFSRTPGSGAFATTHTLPDHLKIYGDLITPKNFKFCIECKKGYNNINLYSLYNYSSEVWDFLDQCEKDSKKCNKIPLILLKQDRKDILAFIPTNEANTFIINTPYINIQSKLTKLWNIYKFKNLLELDDKIWWES